MSLLTKASLVTTPTAYGDGVLNSVKPTNGDGDFDFARASAGTRLNEQGLIEKERGNLILQSNQFDTTWTTSNASVTGGQSGYDGSNDAWLLSSSSNGTESYIRQTLSLSGVGTISIYAKANTANFIAFYIASSGADIYGWFNLSTGASGSVANEIDKTITSVGSGWYRITLSGLNPDQRIDFYCANANGSFLTDSGDSIYIQDAQLEQGLVATDYIETTTAAVYEGITDDIPRINYENGIGSFLLEPQRTNLIQNSEYIHGWLNAGGTSSQNSQDSTTPEGVYNAAVLDASSGLYQSFSISSSAHSYSVYAKAKSGSILTLRIDTPTTKYTEFNLSDGTIQSTGSGHTASIEAVGNGWYRCIISFTDSIVNVVLQTTSSGSVYVWGAQLEASSYPTSYIPTYGTSVTFASETCNNAGNSDTFNDSEGVLYAEIATLVNTDNIWKGISINDDSSSDLVLLYITTTNNTIRAIVKSSGVLQFDQTYVVPNLKDFNKIAIKYKANDFAFWVNGLEVATDTSGTSPIGLNKLVFDEGTGTEKFYGKTKMVSTFKEALSDSELECLTSWSSFNRMATAQGYDIQ